MPEYCKCTTQHVLYVTSITAGTAVVKMNGDLYGRVCVCACVKNTFGIILYTWIYLKVDQLVGHLVMQASPTPMDFFLENLQNAIYKTPLATDLLDFKIQIRLALSSVTLGMLKQVWMGIDYLLNRCCITDGVVQRCSNCVRDTQTVQVEGFVLNTKINYSAV